MSATFVLDNVRSSFNVGSIFRTADGLGFDIHLIGITPIPRRDSKLEKTSLSALEYVKWRYFENDKKWFESLPRSQNLVLSIEETDKFKTISLFDLKNINIEKYENIYLILGHEINGVSEFLMSKSDYVVKIPMYGKKNSLNVGTCAGIVGYQIKSILN